MKPNQLYDLVALKEDLQVEKFMTDEQIILPRGQVGTVVEEYNNGEAFEIEFSDENGQAYALIALKATQLMPIYMKVSQLEKESPFAKFIGILSDEEAQEIQGSIKENW